MICIESLCLGWPNGKSGIISNKTLQYGIYLFWWNLMVRKHIRWNRVASDKNTIFIHDFIAFIVVICYFFSVRMAQIHRSNKRAHKTQGHIEHSCIRIKIDVHFPTCDPISPKNCCNSFMWWKKNTFHLIRIIVYMIMNLLFHVKRNDLFWPTIE